MKQLNLFEDKATISFGGELLKHKRKSARPLHARKALHIVLRVEDSRCGSLLFNKSFIESIIITYARRFGIFIYSQAVVSNHIHLLIRFTQRKCYKYFIRSISGILAKRLGLKWSHRPFTRVVNFGKDFDIAKDYVIQNELEANGVIPYQPRKK